MSLHQDVDLHEFQPQVLTLSDGHHRCCTEISEGMTISVRAEKERENVHTIAAASDS